MSLDLEPGAPCLFVSPHLDDAVLSCGALIGGLRRTNPVTVATIFSSCSPPPHTLSGRAFLRQCGVTDADGLFAERRREDAAVLAHAGARHVHLGFPDALFRVRGHTVEGRPRRVRRHVYPTHRFHVGRGRVSSQDLPMIRQAAAAVDALAGGMNGGYVFFPLAVGRHVDHVISRMIGAAYAGPKIFYADFPYVLHHGPDAAFIAAHQLSERRWPLELDAKRGLVAGYRTQVGALFPGGEIPLVSERFYVSQQPGAGTGSQPTSEPYGHTRGSRNRPPAQETGAYRFFAGTPEPAPVRQLHVPTPLKGMP